MTNTGILEEVALYKMLMLPNENDLEDTLVEEFAWVKDEFCVWIRHSKLNDFIQYFIHEFGICRLDCIGIDARLQSEYVVFNLCELLGDKVDIEAVFPKEKYTY